MKFINKEDIIEAVQFTGDNLEELRKFLGSDDKIREEPDGIYFLSYLTKLTKLYKNNYILKKGSQNWICDSDRFNDIYVEFPDCNQSITKSDFIWTIRNNNIIDEELNKLHEKYNVDLKFNSVDSKYITIILTDKNLSEPVKILLDINTFNNFNEFNQRNYIYSYVEKSILLETSNCVQC